MSEAIKVPMVCVDCGGTMTDDDAIWSPGIGVLTHINYSQCIASLNERLTAATKRAEAAEAECEALRKDAARLDYLADQPVFEGFADSQLDVYELESIVAEQNGRVDPNASDRHEALRRVIDAALAVQP